MRVSANDPKVNWSPEWRKEMAAENGLGALDIVRNADLSGADCLKALSAIGVSVADIRSAGGGVGVVLDTQAHSGSAQAAFAESPDNVAYTPIGGNIIYIRQSYVLGFGASPTVQGTMLHELMHVLGKNDTEIKTALGIDPLATSGAITDQLKTDCFSGKP